MACLAFMVVDAAQCSAQTAGSSDGSTWSRWRGPNGNGIADDQEPVTTWGEDENVIWRVKIPGKGHASPMVTQDRIYLATADEAKDTQSVIALDRASGKEIWSTVVNTGKFAPRIHENNTHASPTIAVAGDRMFALFFNHNQVRVAALDLDGEILWQQGMGDYESPYPFGIGASPIVHGSLVIVPNENESYGGLVALQCATGKKEWSISRPSMNYSTPVIAEVAGKTQLLLSGQEKVAAWNPDTGKELWSVPAKWKVTCGTCVWDDDTVYASGGFPTQQTIAVVADGSGKVRWQRPIKSYEQSMIVVDGALYAHDNKGIIRCWDAKTGKEHWSERFRSPVSASPVFANGMIYFTSQSGHTLVIRANKEKYEEVAINRLGSEAFASFAIAGDRIYTRVGDASLEGAQWLVCLGEK